MARFTGDFDSKEAVEEFVRDQAKVDPKAKIKFSRETDDMWFIWVDGDDEGGWYLYEDGTFEPIR